MDVNNAFIHGYFHEEVYINPPKGNTKAQPCEVCHLHQSLYEKLKACQGSETLNCQLSYAQLDFINQRMIICLFTRSSSTSFITLVLYFDEILITRSSDQDILQVGKSLD